MKVLGIGLTDYEKNLIIDTWHNLGDPEITRESLMSIRKITHNGLFDIKTTILKYKKIIMSNIYHFLNSSADVVVCKPHSEEETFLKQYSIFLAGTIDMGNSEDWQSDFIEFFKEKQNSISSKDKNKLDKLTYVIYNPRRDEGFNDDEKEYEYQVNWELDRLEHADKIIMNILGTSKSPISLMELGNFKNSNIDVICEPNFYRYKYVEMFCKRYNIPLYSSMDDYKKTIV